MPSPAIRKKLAKGFVIRFILFAIITYIKNYFLHYEWSTQKKLTDSIAVGLVVAIVFLVFYLVLIALAKRSQGKQEVMEQFP